MVLSHMYTEITVVMILFKAKLRKFQGEAIYDSKEARQAEEGDTYSEAVDHTSSVETPFSMNQNIAYSSVMTSTHAAAV